MFSGFDEGMVPADGLKLFGRWGGAGPAVLLLHGHPRTSATWHRVAPALAAGGLTVVCLDLPGYGRSDKPVPTPDHVPHSKKVGAGHLLAAMHSLGHRRFAVVGHDRGSLFAFRLALDHPETVSRVALLDCLPVSEHLDRADARFATAWWHWFFFTQPEIPERVITADPDSWYTGDPEEMGAENYAEWRAAMRDPDVVRGMLEDYRAGLTVDYADEVVDRAHGRRLQPTLLLLWSTRDDLEDLYGDPRLIWQDWATDVQGHGIDSGHHLAERAPEALTDALTGFLHPDTAVNRTVATPGLAPPEPVGDDPGRLLTVGGEQFRVRLRPRHGPRYEYDYDWLTGPDSDYGLAASGPFKQTDDDHRAAIQDFLANIDPATGHLSDE